MKSKLKQQNAITLVALIITIIVLLILAMVSISLVINSGIITKSKDSVDKYSAEEITEQLKLAYSEYQMSQYTGTPMTTQDIQAKLGQIFGTENVKDVSLANGKLTATINGKPYEYNTATGTAGEKKPETLSIITKDNYGDYIDLGQSVEGVGSSSSADDWRILYNDKAGHVYAILADYLPNTNSAVTASGLEKIGTYKVYSSTSRDDLLNKLNSTTAWQSLIPEGLRSTCQVKGATTKEIIEASYKEKYNVDSFSYLYIDNDSSKGVDTLFMPRPNSSIDVSLGYWLTSNYVYTPQYGNNALYYVSNIGNFDGASYNHAALGICPVVSLPSNLQVTNNNGVWSLVNN